MENNISGEGGGGEYIFSNPFISKEKSYGEILLRGIEMWAHVYEKNLNVKISI